MTLTPRQRSDWDESGWLHLAAALDDDLLHQLDQWVDEVCAWSERDGPGVHHFEQTDSGPAIARSERFADDHAQLGGFVRGRLIGDLLTDLFGEPAVLFKEKINYKYPGGGGFAPHQDATAYRFVDHHISVMVPVDPATVESGCLYFARGHRNGQMPTDDRGRIEEDFAATLDWQQLETQPGDLVFFDSYAPHRSETNTASRPRRALYLTYNALSKGDLRDAYYADKLDEFEREGESFDDQRVRISISDDFLGRPVDR